MNNFSLIVFFLLLFLFLFLWVFVLELLTTNLLKWLVVVLGPWYVDKQVYLRVVHYLLVVAGAFGVQVLKTK